MYLELRNRADAGISCPDVMVVTKCGTYCLACAEPVLIHHHHDVQKVYTSIVFMQRLAHDFISGSRLPRISLAKRRPSPLYNDR